MFKAYREVGKKIWNEKCTLTTGSKWVKFKLAYSIVFLLNWNCQCLVCNLKKHLITTHKLDMHTTGSIVERALRLEVNLVAC